MRGIPSFKKKSPQAATQTMQEKEKRLKCEKEKRAKKRHTEKHMRGIRDRMEGIREHTRQNSATQSSIRWAYASIRDRKEAYASMCDRMEEKN